MTYNYLTDPNLRAKYDFHLHDVVCQDCGLCNSGSHDWNNIPHKPGCSNFQFDSLIGKTVPFYGVDNNTFKVGPKLIFEAVEDESDGYRSMMRDVKTIPYKDTNSLIFFQRPIAKVIIKNYCDVIYELVDVKDEHIWLTFGTKDYDDYYPYFYFNYTPKLNTSIARSGGVLR